MPLSRQQITLYLLLLILSAELPLYSQGTETLPSGTLLEVSLRRHIPMKTGETVRTQLLYSVYLNNKVLLPEKTTVIGTVVRLIPAHDQRVRARFNGDFTPYRTPEVRFSQIVLSDGTAIPMNAANSIDGAPLLRLTAPAPQKGGFIHRQWHSGVQMLHDQVALITAPEKGDRLLQLFYSHLPCHPQRIESETSWTIETSTPLKLPTPRNDAPTDSVEATSPGQPWTIQAYLEDRLSSKTATVGDPIKALVAEPVYNQDHTIAIPQGSILVGAVTKAAPARSFSRTGKLGFDFRQILLPDGQTQNVQSALKVVDAASASNLAMDSEGKVAPKPQERIVIPLMLALLATRPLDQDGGGVSPGKNFVGANGFGLVGNVIALAGGSPNLSVRIGAYGTALSIYRRWIAHGTETAFARDTRLVIEATPRTSPILKPEGSPPRR